MIENQHGLDGLTKSDVKKENVDILLKKMSTVHRCRTPQSLRQSIRAARGAFFGTHAN